MGKLVTLLAVIMTLASVASFSYTTSASEVESAPSSTMTMSSITWWWQ